MVEPSSNDKEEERDKFGVDSYNDQQKQKGSKHNKAEENEKREFTAFKYKGYEAVFIKGKAVFITIVDDGIKTASKIEDETRIIVPPPLESYPYTAYTFKTLGEVGQYLHRAKNETINSLYKSARSIAFDYNHQSKYKCCLLAIDIIVSYSQDRLPTIHYDVIRGDNGAGKSSMGETYASVAYRPVVLTDPNAANILRILGCIEAGQCTLVADEAGLEQNQDLIAVLKTGYNLRGKSSRVNDYSRDPEFFNTYCFKIIISDKQTNLRDIKGVLDRSFELVTYKGKPKFDIKETLEAQGNPKRLARLAELEDFRKLMLVYRLLHIKDPILDIDVGVDGRDKELVKPVIQLFYDSEAQEEVVETLQHFLDERNEKKDSGLEPIVASITLSLLGDKQKDEESGLVEVYLQDIWNELKNRINGYSDAERDKDGNVIKLKRPGEYHTEEYGTIYNKTISNMLHNVFGGRSRHKSKGVVFMFDRSELRSIVGSYSSNKIIKVVGLDKDDYTSVRHQQPDGADGKRAPDEKVDGSHEQNKRENKGKDEHEDPSSSSSGVVFPSASSGCTAGEDLDDVEAELKRRRKEGTDVR